MRECKDVLQGAVIVKQYYQHMVFAVFAEEEIMDLEQFDQDLRNMLDVRKKNKLILYAIITLNLISLQIFLKKKTFC